MSFKNNFAKLVAPGVLALFSLQAKAQLSIDQCVSLSAVSDPRSFDIEATNMRFGFISMDEDILGTTYSYTNSRTIDGCKYTDDLKVRYYNGDSTLVTYETSMVDMLEDARSYGPDHGYSEKGSWDINAPNTRWVNDEGNFHVFQWCVNGAPRYILFAKSNLKF